MATYNETASGGVDPRGSATVEYTANAVGSGGVTIIGAAAVSQSARRIARAGPSVALLVGGTVSVSLDRDPD